MLQRVQRAAFGAVIFVMHEEHVDGNAIDPQTHYSVVAKNRRRRRRMGRYIRGNVDEEVALTTLASKDVVGAVFDEVVNERTLVSSIVATYGLSNWTSIANAGPVVFGVAHGDYTDAEIEEYLENTGQWNEGNMLAREISSRKIRRIGTFGGADTAAETEVLNDGKPVRTKLNWILNQGQTLRLWAYNMGTAAIATTAPTLTANGHVNLFPK